VGGKSFMPPLYPLKGDSMKKYLIVVCVVLVVAFTGGFLTSHFTSANSNEASSNAPQDCGHVEQIQALMRQIETQQDRIAHLSDLVDLYARVMIEFSDAFEMQYQLIEELLGQISHYSDLVEELNSQIDTMQNLIAENEKTIETLETQVNNLQRELDFWLEADIDNPELLQELIAQNTALLAQVATLENSLQSLQSDFNNLFANFTDLTEAMIELTQENLALSELIDELQDLIDELNEQVEYYKNQAPQADFYSDLGRTKNFVNPINIMETENTVFLWEHFDTQIFLDMLLWEWGNPFFGPTLVGYYVAFEFTVHTSEGVFEYAIEIFHDAGYNPMARAFKDGILQTQSDAPIFNITLTPVTFSYTFNPMPDVVEISAINLNRLTFVHLAPWRGEA
jgi:uncharacterized coiled-coil DUF342 family protein